MVDIKDSILEDMIPITQFRYWFLRESSNEFKVICIDNDNEKVVDTNNLNLHVDENGTILDSNCPPGVVEDFDKYRIYRPEYLVGLPYVDTNYELSYVVLLTGSCLIKSFEDYGTDKLDSVDRYGIFYANRCIEWLHQTDFFHAPGSTRFHDAYPGGLLQHTIRVYNLCCDMWAVNKFKHVHPASFTLTSLVHDWCKINLYTSYQRNVKDDNGQWHKELAYKWSENGPTFAFGHGTTSMFLAMRFFKLSVEESAAIRWHMDSWNVADNEMSDLQTSNERYPLVHMLQFADKLSIVKY